MKDQPLKLRVIPDEKDAVRTLLTILKRVREKEVRINSVIIKSGKPGEKIATVSYEEINPVQ